MSKRFIQTFNFSTQELIMNLSIGEAGVSIGMPSSDNSYEKYNRTSTEKFNTSIDGIATPDTTGMIIPDGLEINKEDYLYVPFRLISATMVAAGSWRSTFFPAKVLKKGVDMLLGKGVFTNHNDNPENWAGFVAKTKWQPASKQNGQDVPAGINALLAIDTTNERNRNVAQGILNGSVFSNSVGIQFEFKMSHDYEDIWEFRERVGTMHEDGRMVHYEVTKVLEIHETSLVSLGADPFAKRIDANGLVNIDNGGVYSESATNSLKLAFKKEIETNSFNISCGLNKNVLFLTGKEYSNNAINNNTNTYTMNKELIKALLAKFNVTSIEDLTVSLVEDFGQKTKDNYKKVVDLALSTVQEKDDSIESVNLNKFLESHTFVSNSALEEMKQSVSKVEQLETEVSELKTKNTSLTASAELGESFVKEQKELAKKLYRLSKGKDADEKVCELFDKADITTLQALIKEHGIVVGANFSYTCSDCGSHEFKFGSSTDSDTTVEKKPVELVTVDTFREQERNTRLK